MPRLVHFLENLGKMAKNAPAVEMCGSPETKWSDPARPDRIRFRISKNISGIFGSDLKHEISGRAGSVRSDPDN